MPPYHPVVPLPADHTLSLNITIPRINHVAAFPSMSRESSSHVIAVGLDLFWTSVVPSGSFDALTDEFLKAPLIVTIVSLIVGVAAMRRASRAKKTKNEWK